jgi:hypothetical protein
MDLDAPEPLFTRKRSLASFASEVPTATKLARTSSSSLRPHRGGSVSSSASRPLLEATSPATIPSSSAADSGISEDRIGSVLTRLATLEAHVDRTHSETKDRIKEVRDMCSDLLRRGGQA